MHRPVGVDDANPKTFNEECVDQIRGRLVPVAACRSAGGYLGSPCSHCLWVGLDDLIGQSWQTGGASPGLPVRARSRSPPILTSPTSPAQPVVAERERIIERRYEFSRPQSTWVWLRRTTRVLTSLADRTRQASPIARFVVDTSVIRQPANRAEIPATDTSVRRSQARTVQTPITCG